MGHFGAEKWRFWFDIDPRLYELANEWKKGQRQKRGGGIKAISFDAMAAEERYRHEPAEESSAELVFDRRWAGAILDMVMRRLCREFEQAGKADRFAELSALLFEEPPSPSRSSIKPQTAGMQRAAHHRLLSLQEVACCQISLC